MDYLPLDGSSRTGGPRTVPPPPMELKQLNNLLPNLPTFKHEDTFGVIKVATRTSE